MTTATSILGVRGIETTADAFRKKLVDVADALGLDADHLATVMSFESGISPTALNPLSGATGLIQFMPSTARQFGTSTTALAQMSAEEQLDFVRLYFERVLRGRRNLSLLDTYLAVFSPQFIGSSPGAVAYASPSVAYEQNKGLDRDKDGVITVGEIGAVIQARYDEGLSRPRVPVGTVAAAGVGTFGVGALLLAGGGALGWYGWNRWFAR